MPWTSTALRNAVEAWLDAVVRRAPHFVRQAVEHHKSTVILALLTAAISFLTVFTLISLKLMAPPSYTATTFIQPYWLRKEFSKDTGQVPMDDKMVIDGAVQLIESHALSRKVAEKLNLDREYTRVSRLESIWRLIGRVQEDGRSKALDLAARDISDRVTIANPRKSHMIEVSYSASSPERAAQITNAIASEYIVFNRTTDIAKTYSRAQRNFQELSSRYGAQHPRVIAARQALDAAQAEIDIAEKSDQVLTTQELLSTGLVIPASAISIPTNRRLAPTIAFGLVLGCLISFALILILEPGARTIVWNLVR